MMQTDSFGELVLEKRVVAALKEMGFEEVGQQIIRGGDVKVSLQAHSALK